MNNKSISNIKQKIALVILFFIHVVACYYFRDVQIHNLEKESFGQFKSTVESQSTEIESRAEVYSDILYSIRALVAVDPDLKKPKWDTYTDSLSFFDRYPGITSIGFTKRVKAKDKNSFIKSLNSEYSEFEAYKTGVTIFPEANKEEYYPVTLFEPFNPASVTKSVGYDLSSEPKRLAALEKSRDSGEPTSTELLILLNDKKAEPSIIVYLPIYQIGKDVSTVEKKRENLEGFAFIAFKLKNLVNNVYGDPAVQNDIDISIHDVTDIDELTESNLLFANSITKSSNIPGTQFELTFAGRKWVLKFAPGVSYDVKPTDRAYVDLLFYSLIISVFVAIIIGYILLPKRVKATKK